MDYTVHGILQGRALSLLQRDLPNPGIEPRSPALWVDSLPAEPQENPENTGVGSLSLLQQIFLTQGLLHCRWVLYQLSYQGSWKINHSTSLESWRLVSLPFDITLDNLSEMFPDGNLPLLPMLLLLSLFIRVRLCDPIDGSPPGSPVPGILQAGTLEWLAIPFSNARK